MLASRPHAALVWELHFLVEPGVDMLTVPPTVDRPTGLVVDLLGAGLTFGSTALNKRDQGPGAIPS